MIKEKNWHDLMALYNFYTDLVVSKASLHKD